MSIFDILKAILYGIVEGITEWLPVSSTGHLILLDKFLPLPSEEGFRIVFDVVIQLFSVIAVVSVYLKQLNPFVKRGKLSISTDRMKLWQRIFIASLPSAIIGILFDGIIEKYLFNPTCVSVCLILYGIVFMIIERITYVTAADITNNIALKIGAFQTLALIPGTSRSGATIIGGLLSGLSRADAARFSFFLALPTMLGASALKLFKFFSDGGFFTVQEITLILVGGISAYIVSLAVIRYLIEFVGRHSFRIFGVYRIVVGVFILAYTYLERM